MRTEDIQLGDIVRGVNCDIEGLILEVISVKGGTQKLKTLDNSKSKFRISNPSLEGLEEFQIGGIFGRSVSWANCMELYKRPVHSWKERIEK